MNSVATATRPSTALPATAPARRIVHQSPGRRHGPITRLVSPHDLGELIKPFVFLDHGTLPPTGGTFFGIHPHSGIATLTLALAGQLDYEDTTGQSGTVAAGGLEWMQAAAGAWHDGRVLGPEPLSFFQLWLALPAERENAAALGQHVAPQDVPRVGPVSVLLGEYAGAASPIQAPDGVHYFHVQLADGQAWRYQPAAGHEVAWIAVHQGVVKAPTPVRAGEIAVFDASDAALHFVAQGATSFVIGIAAPHPHPLVTGYYSVHTSAEALQRGEAEIARIGERLRAAGRIA